MGQKVNPVGLRLGINKTWDSRWFARKAEYGNLLHEDVRIRDALMTDLKQAAVSRVVVERPHRKCRVTIHTARPVSSSARRAPISRSCARRSRR